MLKTRLILTWFILSLVTTAGVYLQLSATVHESQSDQAITILDKNIRIVGQQLLIDGRQRLEWLEDVAYNSPLAELVKSENVADKDAFDRLHHKALPLMARLNEKLVSDLFWVLDVKGRVITRLFDEGAYGDDVGGLPMAAAALNGMASEGSLRFNDKLMQIVGAPLVDRNRGAVVGAVLAGYQLGPAWLANLQSLFDSRFAVFYERKISGGLDDATLSSTIENNLKGLTLAREWTRLNPTGFAFSVGDSNYNARAFLFSGSLADMDAGLVAFKELPPRWLPPGSRPATIVFGGGAVMFLFGILVAFLVSRFVKARATATAAACHVMLGDAGQAKINGSKVIAELRPFIDMSHKLAAELAQQKPKGKIPAGTGRTSEYSPADFTGQPQPSIEGERSIDLADDETRTDSLELTDAEEMINELSQMMESTSLADETPAARPKRAAAGAARAATPSEPPSPKPEAPKKHAATKPMAARVKPTRTTSAQRPIPDNDAEYFEQLYQEFLNMRDMLAQPTHNVNKEKFISNLKANTARIRKKSGSAKVRFTVFEKDGKASIKAAPEIDH